MRWVIVILILFLLALQYKLWFDDGGARQMAHLRQEVLEQKQQNQELAKQNGQLRAEVKDLKLGVDAAEERARSELGMVKQHEEYVQIVQESKAAG